MKPYSFNTYGNKLQIVFYKQTIGFCLLLIGCCQFVNAQTGINLKTAIDTALKNNLQLKTEKQRSEYQQKLIKTATNIPLTNILGEYGQINSIYTDNRFGVSQSFNFPTVYVKQKNLLTEEWKTSVLGVSMKEAELKKAVTQLFYVLLYLREKEKLLLKSDTIYAEFLKKTVLRFAKGESNILEKTTAEMQRGNIELQLKQLQQEKESIGIQFQVLLNTQASYIPEELNFKMTNYTAADSNLISDHPLLKIMQQQKQISIANTQLEKSKLLPDINIGYYNMTMRGIGSDNVLYNGSNRFQSAQVGVGIPLFFGAQKARISASKMYQYIAESNYLQEKQVIEKQYQSVYSQYQNYVKTITYYEQTALKNATLINETASKQFVDGDINYLEWVMLTNQAINIKSNYIDAIKALNESIIQLNYLTSKL